MTYEIAVLRGDGIGPEVVESALSRAAAPASPCASTKGWSAARPSTRTGDPLPPETLELCRQSDAVLLGAVGGPRWEDAPVRAGGRPPAPAPRPGPLREPAPRAVHGPAHAAARRPRAAGGHPGRARALGRRLLRRAARHHAPPRPSTPGARPRPRCERVAHVAFQLARGRRRKVTSVDKANVLETSRLWRRVVIRGRAGLSGRRRSSTATWTPRPSSCIATPHRFDVVAHREPVRRHPQRRGGRGGGLARPPALGLPGRGPVALRARARLGADPRRAAASRTRRARS